MKHMNKSNRINRIVQAVSPKRSSLKQLSPKRQ